jgi:signal transduction histidine kinase
VPALVALATAEDPLTHPDVRCDPAALALILRFTNSTDPRQPIRLRSVDRARLLSFARRQLRRSRRDTHYDPAEVYHQARQAAHSARKLAERDGPDLVDAAEFVASLSFIGALAIQWIDAGGLCDLRAMSRAPEITRRLLRRWRLPEWCVAAVAGQSLTPETSEVLGADRHLVAILQATLSQRSTATPAKQNWDDPFQSPLLMELLKCGARAHQRGRDDMVERLEREVERLHIALADQQRGEADRLLDRKLAALAEFAAGAGHEINTPLAVISGQSQYLLNLLEDPVQRKSLQTIVQQTRRVHEILTELMQFARPARPNLQVLDLALVVHEVVGLFADETTERGLHCDVNMPTTFLAFADAKQARTALQCLIRNAVEAVPAGGWIRVSGQVVDDQLLVIVEDSGSGPDVAIVPHLFDPFYSGRPAGRGRGLGLSTAWRLAKEQGGEVRHHPTADSPARFVLSLPKAESLAEDARQTA